MSFVPRLLTAPGLTARARRAASAAILVGCVATVSACGSSSTSDSAASPPSAADSASSAGTPAPGSLGDVSVQLSWIKNSEFAGEFEADSKGYYAKEGLGAVDLVPGPTSTEALVASGKATFGLSNAVSTAQAIVNSDAPLKIVGTTYQKNPFTILSLADKGNIATPQDLIGKKIGVQDSNLSLFEALLAANHIDQSQLTIVPVQYDPSVLENGQVDGFVAYVTNEALIVKDDGYQTTNLPFADNGLPFVAESVITTDQEIAEHPDVVKAFLAAEIEGWKAACADPKEGAALAVGTYGKDLKPALETSKELAQNQTQCTDLINTDETGTNGLFTISDQLQAANIATMASAGIDITADDLFDTSLLTELLQQRPDLAG